MRYLCSILVFLTAAWGQPVQQKPARERSEEEKVAEREKARELLDAAAKMVASVQPQVQVAALLHLGDNYNLIDKKKSLEALEQAFASAADLPSGTQTDWRGDMQALVIGAVADVDLAKALELLPQLAASASDLPDRRLPTTEKIVRLLLEKSRFDKAIAVVESVGSTGEYPINAARMIFAKLPEDDARRVQVFSAATSAYTARPRGPMGEFLSRHWREVPRPMAESAMQAMLNAIFSKKEESDAATTTMSTAKGNVGFSSPQDRELFDILHVVQAIDPKRANEILETRHDLRAAVGRFPEGTASMRSGENDSMSMSVTRGGGKPDPQQQARQQMEGIARSRAAEAMEVARQDPQTALSLVRAIPSPAIQAQVLGSIARSVSEKDPTTAKSVLDQCIHILNELKDPRERMQSWEIVAEAAYRAKEEQRAREAIDRGMSDAAELYKRDADAERGNSALREYWPSTQSYRRLVHRAATLFGPDAEQLLTKITDPELALLARIEMAQSLLGRATSATQTRFDGGGQRQLQQAR